MHNDATTCQLLSVLNDKREVNVDIVCASKEDGIIGSYSYRKAKEKRPPDSNDNVIEKIIKMNDCRTMRLGLRVQKN